MAINVFVFIKLYFCFILGFKYQNQLILNTLRFIVSYNKKIKMSFYLDGKLFA